MSDNITSNLEGAAWAITGAGTVLVAIYGGMEWSMQEDPAKRQRIARFVKALLLLCLTAWLWFPWLGYGVYRLSKWSLNGIDYIDRPNQVIPLKPTVIDLNKSATSAPVLEAK